MEMILNFFEINFILKLYNYKLLFGFKFHRIILYYKYFVYNYNFINFFNNIIFIFIKQLIILMNKKYYFIYI